jgi:2-polyprenyl-3-methyl-5-hydroxy-6-metoxy-1,4-benzoquinol methylase
MAAHSGRITKRKIFAFSASGLANSFCLGLFGGQITKWKQSKMNSESTNSGDGELPTAELRQHGNQQWWTENTMSYDWKEKVDAPRYSKAWFDEIDSKFYHGARLFLDVPNPFAVLMDIETLPGKRVLEIGCGMGMHTELMLRAGAKLTSIDISPTSIMATTKRLELKGLSGDIRQMDAEHLDFANGEFDLVWSWGVIHHSARTGQVLKQIDRVLQPGGTAKIMVYALDGMSAYITMMRRYALGFWAGRQIDDLLWKDADGFTARFYTKDNWSDLLGIFFEDIETRLFGQDADAVPLPRQLRRPALKLYSKERLMRLAEKRGSMLYSVGRKPA